MTQQPDYDSKYFYAMSKRRAVMVNALGYLGLVSLGFLSVGFIHFLRISEVVAVIFAPLLVLIVVFHAIQFWLMARFSGFDVERHKRRVQLFVSKYKKPPVAVLIPVAGESIDVVAKTVAAAMAIEYKNFAVFILDDSKHKIYQALAAQLGCNYIRRDNPAEHKKAGNLNHALQQTPDFEQYLVLDADFRARPEIINELVCYTGADVGIVQSPQHFELSQRVYKRSKIEYGAAYIQRDFYRITQVARDRYGAAICVGTNALYSRAALLQVGGYEGVGRKEWGHSEDVNTGLKIINSYNPAGKRYRIRYVPIQLAMGDCPDNHHSFYKQQNRWCSGSIQLLFSNKTVRSAHLSLAQKLCYFSNAAYYLYSIGILMTPLYLIILASVVHEPSWVYTLFFIPMLLVNHILTPLIVSKSPRPFAVGIVVLSNAYTFMQAMFLIILRRPLGWDATGNKSRAKSLHFTVFKLMASFIFMAVYLSTLSILIINNNIGFNPSIFVVGLFLWAFVQNLNFVVYTLTHDLKLRTMHLDRKLYAAVLIVTLAFASLAWSYDFGSRSDIVFKDNQFSVVADELSSLN